MTINELTDIVKKVEALADNYNTANDTQHVIELKELYRYGNHRVNFRIDNYQSQLSVFGNQSEGWFYPHEKDIWCFIDYMVRSLT